MGMAAGGITGAGLLGVGLYQRSRMRASQDWLQTVGTIRKADIVVRSDQESTGYAVSVEYEYTAGGARYTGKRIGFSRRQYARKRRAEAELARYPAGSGVVVYFDPQKPSDAVLVRNYPDSVLLIVSGIVLLAIVAAGLWYGER
jgi:hypothetical protein